MKKIDVVKMVKCSRCGKYLDKEYGIIDWDYHPKKGYKIKKMVYCKGCASKVFKEPELK